MALKSTIYKVVLQVNDFDRDHYQAYSLSVALHPSETIERMLIRLLAFSQNAHERLQFTRGLSSDEEPDIWQKSLSDDIELWIDLGMPDLKRIRKAIGRADAVAIYAYGDQKVSAWFDGVKKDLQRLDGLAVTQVDTSAIDSLVPYVGRTMELGVMIQDGLTNVTLGDCFVEVGMRKLNLSSQ